MKLIGQKSTYIYFYNVIWNVSCGHISYAVLPGIVRKKYTFELSGLVFAKYAVLYLKHW